MEEKQEILKALELIKNICKKQEHCDECSFGTRDGYCLIQDKSPEDWELNDTKPLWRAFK